MPESGMSKAADGGSSGASPEEMASYYEDFPTPPTKPTIPPGSPEYEEAWEQYQDELAEFESAKAAYEEENGPAPEPAPVDPSAGGAGGGGGGGGAGKPAARMGDMTSHGGAIVAGAPTVMIGNKPAARVTDMHTCPMVTGVVPHVGGPIVAGSTTVMISFMPAARMGDQATCSGPPDVIAQGEFTVLIG